MSPSTHQDSPKARSICTFCDALVSPYPEPDRCPHCKREVEQVIPVSALLSDEVVERIAKLDYEAAKLALGTWEQFSEWQDGKYADGFRDAARERLQAAIEQVGGAK